MKPIVSDELNQKIFNIKMTQRLTLKLEYVDLQKYIKKYKSFDKHQDGWRRFPLLETGISVDTSIKPLKEWN